MTTLVEEETHERFARLRLPFPPASIGKLPKVSCKACTNAGSGRTCDRHQMGRCQECGNWITSGHVHLDYVGHADVTDRLLTVDPTWNWEPMAYTEQGLPLITNGTLWIKLTVLGVTRLGVGTAQGFDLEKQLIGDALRNAAMRFGVALALWTKAEELESQSEHANAEQLAAKARTVEPPAVRLAPFPDTAAVVVDLASAEQRSELRTKLAALPPDEQSQVKREWKEQHIVSLGAVERFTVDDWRRARDLILLAEERLEAPFVEVSGDAAD